MDETYIGTSKTVDCLIGISDGEEVRLRTGHEQPDQLVLGLINVLVLIDQHVPVPRSVVTQHIP